MLQLNAKLFSVFILFSIFCLDRPTLALADDVVSTNSSDPAAHSSASEFASRHHSQGSVGLGLIVSNNSTNGSSAGGAAQLRLRANGRGIGSEVERDNNGHPIRQTVDNPNGLYDVRFNVTYNTIAGGAPDVYTAISARADFMAGSATRDIRNACGIYVAGSGHVRAGVNTGTNSGSNAARAVLGMETGLACDVAGVLVEVSPTVGGGAATAPGREGASLMAGGVGRVSILDRVHLSGRGMASVPQASSGRPMTLVGADADIRVSDSVTVGLTADYTHFSSTPATAAAGAANPGTDNALEASAVVSTTF